MHMKNYSVAVVVPTLNNFKTIKAVAEDVLSHGYELVIVDDGSDAPVSDIVDIQNDRLHFVKHEKNMGKGQAILTGAQKIKELGYEYFVSMDGDGQHLASEVKKLADKIETDNQIIIGSRNFDIDNVPKKSKVGRAFHNFWIRLNTGYKITDSLSGFRLYPVSILDLNLKKRRFDFEVEVLVKHYWKHKKISDCVIECFYPDPAERVSHFDNYNDTMAIIVLHLKLLLVRVFLLKGVF